MNLNHVKVLAGAVANRNERRAIGRQLAFEIIGRFTPVVAVDHGGLRYFVSTADKVIGRSMFGAGTFDQRLMEESLRLLDAAFDRSCTRGRLFLDVGANIGITTIPAIKVFGASQVHAFEPDPVNFSLLECNVAANGISSEVEASRLAVSDVAGVATLELSGSNSGDHRVRTAAGGSPGALAEASRSTIEIPVTTLDVYLTEHDLAPADLGVVWIDVQGHEGHVLSGASTLVEAGTPIICEYWPYGLRRAGGLSMFHDLVAERYSTIIDVRRSSHGEVVRRPAASVRDLEAMYDKPDTHTDLILVR